MVVLPEGYAFFSARGRKLVGPSRILAAKVLKFGNRDFEGPGEKYPGKIGLPEAAVCRGREKSLEINGHLPERYVFFSSCFF